MVALFASPLVIVIPSDSSQWSNTYPTDVCAVAVMLPDAVCCPTETEFVETLPQDSCPAATPT